MTGEAGRQEAGGPPEKNGGGGGLGGGAVHTYDFKRPMKFSKDNIRTLQIVHESFCRQFGNLLAGILRITSTLSMDVVDQITFEEFLDSVPSPTLICIAGLEPEGKPIIVETSLSLVFGILDRLLGGPGAGDAPNRETTEIEQSIMQDIIRQLLAQLSHSWEAIIEDIRFRLEKMESRAQFAQVIAPTEIVLVVRLKAEVGHFEGNINLCFPYSTLEEILPLFSTERWFLLMTSAGKPANEEVLKSEIELTRVPVISELGSVQLKLGEIGSLKPGQVIRLDNRITDPIVVKIGDKTAFLGRPGTVGKRIAVQVEECVARNLSQVLKE